MLMFIRFHIVTAALIRFQEINNGNGNEKIWEVISGDESLSLDF